MDLDIDKISYGNPTRDYLQPLEDSNYLDKIFTDLTFFSFPKNSSPGTKDELNQLMEYVSSLAEDAASIKRFAQYDMNHPDVWKKFLISQGVAKEEVIPLIDAILKDITPLVTKLKFYFQRPRPAQLAYYFKLKLFPFFSCTADSPSYPSMHAVQARIFSAIIGSKYPKLFARAAGLAEDVCQSRLYLGQHYGSDIDYALIICEQAMNNHELKLKYKL